MLDHVAVVLEGGSDFFALRVSPGYLTRLSRRGRALVSILCICLRTTGRGRGGRSSGQGSVH